MTLTRTQGLLLLLAGLLCVRFVVLPWQASLAESRDRLQVLTDRLDRSETVYANRESVVAALARLETEVEAIEDQFPLEPDVSGFQLAQQQALTQQLQADGLQLVIFDWVLTAPEENSHLHFARFRLQARGEIGAMARFTSALESDFAHATVREIGISPVNAQQIPRQGGTAQLSLLVDLHFRKPAE